jgi:DNA-directed RNA polymerase specialized sigma24 family protein
MGMISQTPAASPTTLSPFLALGEMLTSEQLYRMEVGQLPGLTRAQEQEVAARAQAGEDVRDTILLSLQPRLFTLASRYARYGSTWLDLCQSASLAMLESYQQAITKRNPFAYLLGVARLAMIACISGRDDLIKTHHHRESVSVLSLDKPLTRSGGTGDEITLADVLTEERYECSAQEPELDYGPLYRAIAALPEGLRVVIERIMASVVPRHRSPL